MGEAFPPTAADYAYAAAQSAQAKADSNKSELEQLREEVDELRVVLLQLLNYGPAFLHDKDLLQILQNRQQQRVDAQTLRNPYDR